MALSAPYSCITPMLHDSNFPSMGFAVMQVWASGGSNLTASTCSPSLGVQLQVACKKSWPQQLQCWTPVHRSPFLNMFSTHLSDAHRREHFAQQVSHVCLIIACPMHKVTASCWHPACSLLLAVAHVFSQDTAYVSPEVPCACQATSSNSAILVVKLCKAQQCSGGTRSGKEL